MSVKNEIEALLYSSGSAMGEDQLTELVSAEKKQVKNALKRLQQEYDEREGALKIVEDTKTWKIVVREQYLSLVRRIVAETELSRATLETLAVIAYHHPKVLQSKVIDVRGSNAYEHIGELVELGFITKEKEGRSFALKLASKFFDYFDVEGKDVKEALKSITPPEQQQKLGDLNVVDVSEEVEKPPEVPGEPESEESEEDEDELPPLEGEKIERDVEGERSWLTDLDSKIDSLTKKNDENDSDESFKRKEPDEDSSKEEKQE